MVSAVPMADGNVDLGVSPLTRRQARQQERIRTASVPVITPDLMAAHIAASEPVDEQRTAEHVDAPAEDHTAEFPAEEPEAAEHDHVEALFKEPAPDALVDEDTASDDTASDEPLTAGTPLEEEHGDHDENHDEDAHVADELSDIEPDAERPVLRPGFGSELLAGAEPVELPPSFDQLIARNATSTGSQSTSNALILSQTPSHASIVGPVTATGEVLITGSMSLPDGLGSTGHATGTADGKETDAVLIDREIPAHSSPTPIAASAAVSTVKGAQEIIRPPAPEKGSRLMLTLAITAGALALALVGVLILAFVTGVF